MIKNDSSNTVRFNLRKVMIFGLSRISLVEGCIISLISVISLLFLHYLQKQTLLFNFAKKFFPFGLSLSLTLFTVLFTGHAIFQAILAGKLLKVMMDTSRGEGQTAYTDLSTNLSFSSTISLITLVVFTITTIVIYAFEPLPLLIPIPLICGFMAWWVFSVALLTYTFVEIFNMIRNLNTIVHIRGLLPNDD